MHILVVLNGFGAVLKEKHGPKTLYELSRKKHLNSIAESGAWGYVHLGRTLEKGYFSLFEPDENRFPGESYLRCLENGFPVEKGQTLFLGRFLTQDQDRIVDTDINLSQAEIAALLNRLAERKPFLFRPLENEAVIIFDKQFPKRYFPPPGNLKGRNCRSLVPVEKEFLPVSDLMRLSSGALERDPVNKVREDLGENVANFLYLWAMGRKEDRLKSADRLGDSLYFYAHSGRLNGLAKFLDGIKQKDLAAPETERGLWWLNVALSRDRNPAAWIKELEFVDREILGAVCGQGKEAAVLVIFDGFSREDAEQHNTWAVFLSGRLGSGPAGRLGRRYRKAAQLLKDFLSC